jgi:23S rRNA pseudouridine2605 synthase
MEGAMQERLHKFMARSGVASRRRCEELIRLGRVTVNGSSVTAAVTIVDPDVDVVAVDGVRVAPQPDHLYLALHKPAGVVTTVSDTHGRPTVMSLAPAGDRRLFPVGRLDMDSEGLLLLTDDGDLAFALMHPSRRVPKTYSVELARPVTSVEIRRLEGGVKLEDGMTAPASLRVVDKAGRVVEVTISEGRKRQVRRMFAALGNEVVRLTRIAFGGVQLGNLACGAFRELTAAEVRKLRSISAVKERSGRQSGERRVVTRSQKGGPSRGSTGKGERARVGDRQRRRSGRDTHR